MGIEQGEQHPHPKSNFTKLKEGLARFVRSWKEPVKTALQADKNPDEGKLRASQMPKKYMNIPDDLSTLDHTTNHHDGNNAK